MVTSDKLLSVVYYYSKIATKSGFGSKSVSRLLVALRLGL